MKTVERLLQRSERRREAREGTGRRTLDRLLFARLHRTGDAREGAQREDDGTLAQALGDLLTRHLVPHLVAELRTHLPSASPPQPGLSPDLLTPDEVARRLGLSKSGVYKLAQRGTLPGVKVGSRLRFRPAAVEAYLDGARPDSDRVTQLAAEARKRRD